MGAHRPRGRDQVRGGSLNSAAARVVPNVPSFSVDRGFWYRVPDHLDVEVGSQVRVPLSGRRVRGWVVEVEDRPAEGLKDLSGVSGESPVFDGGLLRALEWAARHYVAPVSVLLGKATPPNLPGRPGVAPQIPPDPGDSRHPLAAVSFATAEGRKQPTTALVGRWQGLDWLPALTPVLAAGRSVAVATATGAEVSAIAETAGKLYGERVIAVPTEGDAAITAAWVAAQRPGVIVIGPPRLASWKIARLGLFVILEEGRRAMKDRQTPTVHVRDLVRRRALTEGFNLAFLGPTPSVELLAAGAITVRVGARAWGLVEIVDRRSEAPGRGLLSDRVVAALRSLSAGERAFVLTGRKMVESLVEEANRRIGRGAAGQHPDGVFASVGTERDLAGLEPVRLAVAANIDMMPGSAGYRGDEEAIRQLARLANLVRPRGRMMAQTDHPESALAATLRRADPLPYLESVLATRIRLGMPPSREMLAVEVRGDAPPDVAAEVAALSDEVEVMGPVTVEDGLRWLVVGDLSRIRDRLRGMAGTWRERGATVRIDADPIDL